MVSVPVIFCRENYIEKHFTNKLVDNEMSEDFARGIGVSRMTLNNWLTGRSEISETNKAAFYEYAFKSGIRLNKIKEQLYREDTVSESEVLLFHGAKMEIVGTLNLDCSRKNNDFCTGWAIYIDIGRI